IEYNTFDNLNEITQTQQYDGDGVTITFTNGVPNAPSASLLRAQVQSAFDEQGRVYQSKGCSVNQSTGAVSSTALTTNTWFDHRGNDIKTSDPGDNVNKSQFDGANRTTKSFITDGGGDSTWDDAANVTGDNVLSQVEETYDSDGNTILTVTRERFHDET